jgi:uncharacterized membrane protein
MKKLAATYVATLAVMLVLDLLWLGVVATPVYQAGIGHLMAAQPRIGPALVFYLLFPVGLLVFAVLPQARAGTLDAVKAAALFGLFTYGTYDMTNLATLKDWPLGLSLLDTAWGCTVSTLAALAGRAAYRRM